MIRFACKSCDRVVDAPPDTAGTQIRCPHCKAPCRVPQKAAPRKSEPEVDVEDDSAESTALGETARTIMFVSGVIVVVLLVGVLIITTIQLWRDPTPLQEAMRRLGGYLGQAGDAAASAGSVLLVVGLAVVVLLYIPLVIWMAAWVSRDAHNRNHSGLGWCVFYLAFQGAAISAAAPLMIFPPFAVAALVFGWVGLAIYLGGRRRGSVVACRRCPNKKLSYTDRCPHCGHGKKPKGAPVAE